MGDGVRLEAALVILVLISTSSSTSSPWPSRPPSNPLSPPKRSSLLQRKQRSRSSLCSGWIPSGCSRYVSGEGRALLAVGPNAFVRTGDLWTVPTASANQSPVLASGQPERETEMPYSTPGMAQCRSANSLFLYLPKPH